MQPKKQLKVQYIGIFEEIDNKSAVTKFQFGLLEEQLPCYSNTKYPFIFYPF